MIQCITQDLYSKQDGEHEVSAVFSSVKALQCFRYSRAAIKILYIIGRIVNK